MSEQSDDLNFEKQLAELEALVERLESGELSLEDSLKAYEQGVRLARQCQKVLDQAQLRIENASAEPGEAPGEPQG